MPYFIDEKTVGSERAKNLGNATQQAELDLPRISACNRGTELPSKWLAVEGSALLPGAFYCEDVLVFAGWQKAFLLKIKFNIISHQANTDQNRNEKIRLHLLAYHQKDKC